MQMIFEEKQLQNSEMVDFVKLQWTYPVSRFNSETKKRFDIV